MNESPQNTAPKSATPAGQLGQQPADQQATPNATQHSTRPEASTTPGATPSDTASTDANGEQSTLNSYAHQALAQGKKWLDSADLGQLTNQLPQSVRNLGSKLVGGVRSLSTTQKVVGGAALAVGLGWLATRGGRSASAADNEASDNYREKFDGQPFSGKGKPRYASSADQPANGRSGKY